MLIVMMQMMTNLLENVCKVLEIKYRERKSPYPENIPFHLTSVKQIFVFLGKEKIPNILVKPYIFSPTVKAAPFIQFHSLHVSFNARISQ